VVSFTSADTVGRGASQPTDGDGCSCVGDVRASLFMLTWSLIPVRHADRKHGQGRDPLVDECVRHPAIRRTLPLGARGSRVPDVENERAPNWLPPFFFVGTRSIE
jgi:hypothetical protein